MSGGREHVLVAPPTDDATTLSMPGIRRAEPTRIVVLGDRGSTSERARDAYGRFATEAADRLIRAAGDKLTPAQQTFSRAAIAEAGKSGTQAAAELAIAIGQSVGVTVP